MRPLQRPWVCRVCQLRASAMRGADEDRRRSRSAEWRSVPRGTCRVWHVPRVAPARLVARPRLLIGRAEAVLRPR